MRFLLVPAVLLLIAPAAAQSTFNLPPQGSVAVLVDLSATWLNDADAKLNDKVLKQVASAIASTVADVDPPVVVRYMAIGDYSLSREPLCEVTLLPQIITGKRDRGVVNTVQELGNFLTEQCIKFVMSRKNEKFTDITGAFDSVARANQDMTGPYRAVIVLSDLKEERRAGQKGAIGRLDRTKVVLLYRTLPQDRNNSVALDARIAAWAKKLTSTGATVKSMADVYATAGTIAGAIGSDR